MAHHEPDTKEVVSQLNSLLRGEISAKETYQQAIDKLSKDGDPDVEVLREIAREHTGAVDRLRDAVRRAGGEPDESAGAWGAFAKGVEGIAKAFGEQSSLKALKEGEEHGLKDYEEALDDVDVTSRQVIAGDLIPAQQRHIQILDSLIAKR